jgi:hypothetical protein
MSAVDSVTTSCLSVEPRLIIIAIMLAIGVGVFFWARALPITNETALAEMPYVPSRLRSPRC